MSIDNFLVNRGWHKSNSDFYFPGPHPHLHLNISHTRSQVRGINLGGGYANDRRNWSLLLPHINFFAISAGGINGAFNFLSPRLNSNNVMTLVANVSESSVDERIRRILPAEISSELESRNAAIINEARQILQSFY